MTFPSTGEIREGSQERCLSCPLATKEREVCSWQKAQLVQRPGSRTQSAVQEAASSVRRPERRVTCRVGEQGGLLGFWPGRTGRTVVPSLRWEQRTKSRLGGHAELHQGPVESELSSNVEGRRQLDGKSWTGGTDLV